MNVGIRVRVLLVAGVAFVLLMSGCGGGGSSTPPPTTPGPSSVAGAWDIDLGTSQNARFVSGTPNNTHVAINFTQDGGVLNTSQPLFWKNTGCGTLENWWASTSSDWTTGSFGFKYMTGTVSGQTVQFTLFEAMSLTNPTDNPHGQVVFTGNVSANGTMSGTLVDGCNNNASSNWTATRMTVLPIPPAPSFVGMNYEPRSFPSAPIDNPILPDGRARDIVNINCTQAFPGVPTFIGHLVVQDGMSPYTFQTGPGSQIPHGMTLEPATGKIIYTAPDCSEQGAVLTVVYHIADSQGRPYALDLTVKYGIR